MTQRVTIEELRAKTARGERLTMLTAYDYSLATWVDRAGVDMILVGDSLGMVMLGHATTAPVTMADMLHHAQAVSRAVQRALIVGDLPKEAMDASPDETVRHAQALLKAGCDAVKIEWRPQIDAVVRRLVDAGIAVMGHVGLTPQSVDDPSQFRVQGRTAEQAFALVESSRQLERAGCFSIVLECIPAPVADTITQQLAIPTIGIGAGAGCDGQVLVLHDLLGLYPLFSPKFAKPYAQLGESVVAAVRAFRADVHAQRFPSEEHQFAMKPAEWEQFRALISGAQRAKTPG